MTVYAVVGFTVIAALLCVLLKKHNPEYSLMISLAAGAVLIFFAVQQLSPALSGISSLAERITSSGEYIKTLFKCLGICFIAQIAADSCRDAGESSLGAKAEMAGRLAIAVMTIPMLEQLAKAAISLIEGQVK